MKRPSWFLLGALLFGLWGIANTWVTLSRYGLDQGMYLWYCNAALVATAVGLWKKNRGLLLAFLGVGAFTHPLYLLDSLWHLTLGSGLFAAAEFMYQPGMPMGEFLLSRYHYFLIPVMILAVCHLKRGKDHLYTYISVFQVGIFGLSYFVFPASQNVNCIHESCFANLPYSGPLYAAIFFALIAGGNVAASWAFDRGLSVVAERPSWHKLALRIFLGVTLVGLVLTGFDVAYKARQPKFSCAPAFEDSGVRVECLYTLEHNAGVAELTYSLENKLDVAQHCDTRGDLLGEFEEFEQGIYLTPKAKLTLKALIPYQSKDSVLKIAASCIRMQ